MMYSVLSYVVVNPNKSPQQKAEEDKVLRKSKIRSKYSIREPVQSVLEF